MPWRDCERFIASCCVPGGELALVDIHAWQWPDALRQFWQQWEVSVPDGAPTPNLGLASLGEPAGLAALREIAVSGQLTFPSVERAPAFAVRNPRFKKIQRHAHQAPE